MTFESRVLFVDAYDSFSANIVALLRSLLRADVVTIKIDADADCLGQDAEPLHYSVQAFDAVVLGPGPGNPINPSDIGLFPLIWRHAAQAQVPVLGICLGFQTLCTSFGLPVSRLDLPCHGHAKIIQHHNDDIFKDSDEVIATCYNSLGVRKTVFNFTPDISRPASSASNRSYASNTSVDVGPTDVAPDYERDAESYGVPGVPLRNLAYDEDGYVMAIRHQSLPFWGLQFHPESCKSNAACDRLLKSWWAEVQLHNSKHRPYRQRGLDTVPKSQNHFDATQMRSSPASLPYIDCLQSLTTSIDQIPHFETLPFSCDKQLLADLCHSLSASGSVAMLESTKRGRFSIFTLPHESTWHLTHQNGKLCVWQDQTITQEQCMPMRDALQLIEEFLSTTAIADGAPEVPFWGGFIGFHSYEAGLDLLEVSTTDRCSSRTVPDLSLMWVDRSIVVDHQGMTTTIQTVLRDDDIWLKQTTATVSALSQDRTSQKGVTSVAPTETCLPSHDAYISKIHSCRSSLYAGDSYELCLTTSTTLTTQNSPYALYTSLQQSNPAPYAAYLHLLNTHVLSSSPEQFLSWSRDLPYLDMKPMKGTLPKSHTINTFAKAREILLNPKEEAENLMIADLIRHDLHSALGPGGHVAVEKLFEVVETESLYQLISHIRGYIPMPAGASERKRRLQIMRAGHRALRSGLPAGSMTGAPKKRSCEILRSLEQRHRGVYSGVIGFFDVGGGGEWSVAIRCAFSHESEDTFAQGANKGGRDDGYGTGEEPRSDRLGDGMKRVKKWHIGAGGAITVLSNEEAEWEEMNAKMGSVLRGFGVTE